MHRDSLGTARATSHGVNLLHARLVFVVFGLAVLPCARGQQAVSPIEQARLLQELPAATSAAVDANGTPLADEDTSSDDSFGKEVILKSRPRAQAFVVTGDASVFYTNNVALTRRDRINDTFFVANAGVSWSSGIAPNIEAQVAAHGSIFRYHSTSVLDFENLGVGAGLFWSPEHFAGVGLFAHYDFIELLNRNSEEILRDHAFTLGAQKAFPLGRAHGFVAGVTLVAGVSEPESAQRDQAGLFLAYRLQVTRSIDTEILYRFAGHFYNDTGRIDRNQVFSATMRYSLSDWADFKAFFSLADNRSDDAAFNYDAAVGGVGIGATIRF